jgi:WD40 repeat protein
MVWDVNGVKKATLEGPVEGVEFVTWHPRGAVVLAGSEDFSAWMWNAASGACMQVFTGHSGSVNCGAFTPDGKTVCLSVQLFSSESGPRSADMFRA